MQKNTRDQKGLWKQQLSNYKDEKRMELLSTFLKFSLIEFAYFTNVSPPTYYFF